MTFTVPFSIYLRGEVTIAPFLYASSQAVLGYFIGIYLDRAATSTEISYSTAAWQGTLQLAATLIASLGSPALPGTTWNVFDVLAINAFVAVQSTLSGFLIGVLFQHFNKRTAPLAGKPATNLASPGVPLVGPAF